jgi:hypothetical protein
VARYKSPSKSRSSGTEKNNGSRSNYKSKKTNRILKDTNTAFDIIRRITQRVMIEAEETAMKFAIQKSGQLGWDRTDITWVSLKKERSSSRQELGILEEEE